MREKATDTVVHKPFIAQALLKSLDGIRQRGSIQLTQCVELLRREWDVHSSANEGTGLGENFWPSRNLERLPMITRSPSLRPEVTSYRLAVSSPSVISRSSISWRALAT